MPPKPHTPVSDLEAHLGYWLRLVSNRVSHAFRLKVESRGVTVAEWVVLRALYDAEEAHPSEIAESIGLTRGAVSKLIDRLAAKRLISVRHDAADRRFQTVRLTPKGRDLVPQLARLADENDAEFFGPLARAERETLRQLLKQLTTHHGLTGAPVE